MECEQSVLTVIFSCSFSDTLVRKSGLLDNDNIVVSRKANSYVLTAVVQTKENKRTYNSAKKLNGAEAMLKKAGVGESILLLNSWLRWVISVSTSCFKSPKTNRFRRIHFAEGVSLSAMRTRSQQAATENAPEVTVINKSKSNQIAPTPTNLHVSINQHLNYFHLHEQICCWVEPKQIRKPPQHRSPNC